MNTLLIFHNCSNVHCHLTTATVSEKKKNPSQSSFCLKFIDVSTRKAGTPSSISNECAESGSSFVVMKSYN